MCQQDAIYSSMNWRFYAFISVLTASKWNSKVHHNKHKRQPFNQLIVRNCFPKICVNIVPHLCLGLQSGRFPTGFSTNNMTSFGPLHWDVKPHAAGGRAVLLQYGCRSAWRHSNRSVGSWEVWPCDWALGPMGSSVTVVTRLRAWGSIAGKSKMDGL